MKTLKNNLRKAFLTGVIALGSVLPISCGGGSRGGSSPPTPSGGPPVISTIEDRIVDEEGTLVVDLNSYVSDPNGLPVTISTVGVGSAANGILTYNDQRDDDANNDAHLIRVHATNFDGLSADAQFNITQTDLRSHIQPSLSQTGKYICYSPTNFNPDLGIFPAEQSIRDDLKVLLKANFKGIITYGSDNILGQIPRIAKEEGFSRVIMGIWNPDSVEEWNNAVAAQTSVDDYCLGNEGLLFGRYTRANLEQKMEDLRRATGKAVTTSEPHGGYDDDLILNGDWIFPNVHPYWSNVKDPVEAANWTVDRLNELKASGTRLNRTVQIKEAGLPSDGDTGLSEQNQNDYYRKLESLITPGYQVPYFEGFNQPWKQEGPGVGSNWGYFNADRSTKKASEVQIDFTTVSVIGDTSGTANGKTLNANPSDYNVATYIKVASAWWFKPYWDSLTSIRSDGTWTTDITTGGTDYDATEVYSAVVAPDFNPDDNWVYYPPLNSDNPKVITGKFYTR